MRLENAMRSVRATRSVVVLHYAPVVDTIEGEPLEIFPFSARSRLAETIDRFRSAPSSTATPIAAASRAARRGGNPVYNVARPMLTRKLGVEFVVFDV